MSKTTKITFRLTQDENQKINKVMESMGVKEETMSEKWRNFVKVIINSPMTSKTVNAETVTPSPKEPFNYEIWEPECSFATYIPEKKLVHCKCTWKSVLTWLPKNRLVNPQVCDKCFFGESYGSYGYVILRRVQNPEQKYSPTRKITFPFYCALVDREYLREEDFTTKHCVGCPNKHCQNWMEAQT